MQCAQVHSLGLGVNHTRILADSNVDSKTHLRCGFIDWSEIINENQEKWKRPNVTILLLMLTVCVVFTINTTIVVCVAHNLYH